jgi:ribonuclease HI
MTRVEIWCDGSCFDNPGPGGWAAYFRVRGTNKTTQVSGGAWDTNSQRMEMTAAIEALRMLKRPCQVWIYTDCQSLIDGMRRYLPKWKARGWLNRDGKPLEDRDLFLELDRLCQLHRVDWRWVRGHTGNPTNELVHELAFSQAVMYQEKIKRILG